MVCKNLIVYDSSKIFLNGMVNGSVIINGGIVEIIGMVFGDVIKKDGTVQIDNKAVIKGSIIGI